MTRETLFPRLFRFTVMATWLGLLAGLVEVAMVVIRKDFLHQTLHYGAHVVWMAPLGDAVSFALAGGFVALVTWCWELRFRPVPSFRVFAFVMVMAIGATLVWWTPWLSERAGLVLAVGVSWQIARWSRDREAFWLGLSRRGGLPVALCIAALGVGTEGWNRWSEARQIAALPPPPIGAPNILLLVLDTVSAEWLSLYGYDRPTSPRLEAFARSGAVFEHVYATAPWTLASHASFFTGRYAHELNVDWWNPLDGRFPTLAERLTSLGYFTGGFPANQAYGDPVFGLARGFEHYETYPDTWEELWHNFGIGRRLIRAYKLRRLLHYWNIPNRKNAAEVNREFLRWEGRSGSRPFFAFLNYFDTHEPYYPPAPYDSLFGPGLDPLPAGTRIEGRVVVVPQAAYHRLPAPAVKQLRNAYDGSLAYLDAQIGRMLQELDRRGRLDNTVVIVTADHGEMRGEVGRFSHGVDVYRPVLHVPLIIRFPRRIRPGVRIAEAASLRDLPATIADLAGLKGRLALPGSSLLPPEGQSERAAPRSLLISFLLHTEDGGPGARSIILGRDHYIQYTNGKEEFFDVVEDPLEVRNLLGPGAVADRAAELRALLDSAWAGSARVPWSTRPEK